MYINSYLKSDRSMNQYSANATTGCLGQPLAFGGVDLNDLTANDLSEVIPIHKRDVDFVAKATLGEILTSDKLIKFDLIARKVLEEGYPQQTPAVLSAKGSLKDIKIGTMRYRMFRNTYYGAETE